MLVVLLYATFKVSLCLFPSEADGCVWKLFLLEVITPLIFFFSFSERHPRNSQNQPQHRSVSSPQSDPGVDLKDSELKEWTFSASSLLSASLKVAYIWLLTAL